MIKMRLFEAMLALEEEGSISAAAFRCGVSQPAMSAQLRSFEEELGALLVERRKRGVIFTSAGKEVLERARVVAGCVREIEKLAEEWASPYSGNLSLGAFPTLAPYLFPRIAADLVENYPDILFFLEEAKTEDLLASLHDGTLDAAFIALPFDDTLLTFEGVFHEDFLALVPDSERWRGKSEVSIGELNTEPLLLLEEGHCLRGQALEVCSADIDHAHMDLRASSLSTLMQMVRIGHGVTLIPACAVAADMPGLLSLPVRATPRPGRTIGLCWRESSPRRDVFREIADDVRRMWAAESQA
jgi:LysR family hydrogen peroxide-inducible transcriptional activator